MKTRLQRTRKHNEGEEVDDMDDMDDVTQPRDKRSSSNRDDHTTNSRKHRAASNNDRDNDVTAKRRAEVKAAVEADVEGDDDFGFDDDFDADETVRFAAADVRDDTDSSTDAADEDWENVLGQLGVEETAIATTGASVMTIEHQPGLARNPAVEALWFRLSNPDFVTTALVPVPNVTSSEANDTAVELAKIGAAITGEPVHVVTAVGLQPSEAAETSRNIAEGDGGQTIVVVESPGVDPSSIPILRSCDRVVLLVGLERSRGDALASITDLIGADRVVGSVCLERDKKRRWWNLRRR